MSTPPPLKTPQSPGSAHSRGKGPRRLLSSLRSRLGFSGHKPTRALARARVWPIRVLRRTWSRAGRAVRSLPTLGAKGVVVMIAALGLSLLAVVILAGNPFDGTPNPSVQDNAYPTGLATVREGPLSSQVNASGTLGYAAQPDGSPYSLVNQAKGTYTWLPAVGQVIGCGQVLYRVDDSPVVLLCGSTPVYRPLSEGMSGPDVQELNAQLVALGYARPAQLDPIADYLGSNTVSALKQLQNTLGVAQTGSLELGQAVFLPGPLRMTKVSATLGTQAQSGAQAAQATSTTRQVEVDLDAAQQTGVKVGDNAQIQLPTNQTTQGVVSAIGTVASSGGSSSSGSSGGSSGSSSSSASSNSGSSQATTIPVYIALNDPQAAGTLDQAPVQVQISTAGVANATIVPVNALLVQAGGQYSVETVDAHGVHRLVPVTVGLFDDADGLVQVTGTGLVAGDRVVVPAT